MFIDTIDHTTLDDFETCDRSGADVVGIDEDLTWWGTDLAAWYLSGPRTATPVVVRGWLGPMRWEGVFLGTEDEALDYAFGHSVKEAEITP